MLLLLLMKQDFIDIILKYVKLLAPSQRKPKYDANYYLTNILDMLNDFNSWRSLTKSINININKGSIVDLLRMKIMFCYKRHNK